MSNLVLLLGEAFGYPSFLSQLICRFTRFNFMFSWVVATASESTSIAKILDLGHSRAEAIDKIPDPQPISKMRFGATNRLKRDKARKHPSVVPWVPEPNALPASISILKECFGTKKRSCDP